MTMNENEKYSYLYEHGYGSGDRSFQKLNHAKRFIDFKDQTVVEYGCGRGLVREQIDHKSYLGVDVASALIPMNNNWGANEMFVCEDIRFFKPKDVFDIALSFDVMEHIPTLSVYTVLENIISSAKTSVIGISCVQATSESPDDDNLHRTVRTPKWWKGKIEKYGYISHMDITGSGSYVVFIITENKMIFNVLEPTNIPNMRKLGNGSFMIPRKNQIIEKRLDAEYARVPNERRWYQKYRGECIQFTEDVYIIGKGPSLDNLSASDFLPDRDILCINDSVHKVKSLGVSNNIFVFHQDPQLVDKCKAENVTYVLHPHLRSLYKGIDCHFIEPMSVGAINRVTTGAFAVCVAKFFGVKGFIMMCFDACVNKELGYADCIGYTPDQYGNDDDNRFLKHRAYIDKALGMVPVSWVIPRVPR